MQSNLYQLWKGIEPSKQNNICALPLHFPKSKGKKKKKHDLKGISFTYVVFIVL